MQERRRLDEVPVVQQPVAQLAGFRAKPVQVKDAR